MRQFIKTFEFTGKLEINGKFFKDNVRCIYHDDYYSNKTMKGEFYVDYLSTEFLNNFNEVKFEFVDKSGRILKGSIHGFSEKSEYNERWDILYFEVAEYFQRLIYSENEPKSLVIKFFLPFIDLFSRNIKYSYGSDDSYLFKYSDETKKLCINQICIEFLDRSYLVKEIEPNSKFVREIYPKITIDNFDYRNILNVIEVYNEFMKDFFTVVSFILHHRIFSFGYHAQLFDENEKLTEFIENKHRYNLGNEFIKENINHEFNEFFTMSNISSLVANYQFKKKNEEQLERILFSYISIKELLLFEAVFLSAFSTLEGISKLIVKPINNMSPEELIKRAIAVTGIDIKKDEFSLSQSRNNKSDSKLEWLITEYRNYLTHFNKQKFDMDILSVEYKKIMNLVRKLILYYISPGLVNWPEP